jgi:hypothetical protein
METRFNVLTKSDPDRAKELLKLAEEDVKVRWSLYEQFAHEDGGEKSPVTQ